MACWPSATFHYLKSLFSGISHSLSLYSTLVNPPLWNIFLLPLSWIYLLYWTQNLVPEENMKQSSVLVTSAFLNLRVWRHNVGLTYLEVLIRVGRWSDWTMSCNTQVLSISLLCETQCQLHPKAVFSVVTEWPHVPIIRPYPMLLHSYPWNCMWMGTEEGGRERCYPRTLNQSLLFCLTGLTYVIYPWAAIHGKLCSEFLNQLLIGEKDFHNWLRLIRVSPSPDQSLNPHCCHTRGWGWAVEWILYSHP